MQENPERHTVYLTVMLFVHFLSGKKCGAADNAKKQSVLLRFVDNCVEGVNQPAEITRSLGISTPFWDTATRKSAFQSHRVVWGKRSNTWQKHLIRY